MSDDDQELSLLYPFVVCSSNGGPYDDQSFVAGATFGKIEELAKLLQPGGQLSWMVPPALVPQLDLLAMHEGCDMVTVPWNEHPEAWAFVKLTKATVDG